MKEERAKCDPNRKRKTDSNGCRAWLTKEYGRKPMAEIGEAQSGRWHGRT